MECAKMFGFDNKAEYIKAYNERFYDLSAKFQPCGTPTSIKKDYWFDLAFVQDRIQFEWTHLTRDGEELPTHVTFTRTGSEGSYMIVAYVQGLRKVKEAEEKVQEANWLRLPDCRVHRQHAQRTSGIVYG